MSRKPQTFPEALDEVRQRKFAFISDADLARKPVPVPKEEVGIKHDFGKLRWDLIPFASLREIVRVITFGATKYGPGNWKNLSDPDARYFAACLRHLSAHGEGELLDPETGISHLAHAGCNILFLLAFQTQEEPE